MRRTRVKICGVTRPEDAAIAAACGADAVGMIFHPPSARNVTVENGKAILAVLPPFVTPVGLFVDAAAEQVREIAGRLGLRHVQLHGEEPAEVIESLGELFVLKAVRADRAKLERTLSRYRGLKQIRGLVLETAGTAAPGGTGIANDWDFVRQAVASGLFEGLPPIIAAGGLDAKSVGDVVRTIRPWAVDVSSGVEEVRGEKSEKLVRAFIDAVRKADAEG